MDQFGKDQFDVFGEKLARAFVETLEACDVMAEPFRTGGIAALIELHHRFTGGDFDWEDFKLRRAKFNAAHAN